MSDLSRQLKKLAEKAIAEKQRELANKLVQKFDYDLNKEKGKVDVRKEGDNLVVHYENISDELKAKIEKYLKTLT